MHLEAACWKLRGGKGVGVFELTLKKMRDNMRVRNKMRIG